MAGNPLKDFYTSLEDGYYGFCDYLQQKLGIPIYDAFVTPIEGKGIPSFPVFLLSLLIIIIGGYFAMGMLFPGSAALKVSVQQAGVALEGVPVTLEIEGTAFKTVNSGADGVAAFENVPPGKTAKIKIAKEGFENYEKIFSTSKGLPLMVASLQPSGGLEGGKVRVSLKVADANGIPLGGASVAYFDSDSGAYEQAVTDATGLATLLANSRDSELSVTVTKAQYQAAAISIIVSEQTSKALTLQKQAGTGVDEGGSEPAKGQVLVTVEDEVGAPIDATVRLVLASGDEVLGSERTFESGKARFRDVDAVGFKLYVVAEPRDAGKYLVHDGSANAETLSSKAPLEFFVQLRSKGLAEDYNITITATEKNGAAIQGAKVRPYNSETNAPLYSGILTDASGKAVFSTDKIAYVTISKNGYLPNIEADLEAGNSKIVQLEKVNEDNSADVKVTVLDADGNLAEGARVNLLTEEGFFTGIAEQTSLEDGTALFTGVPLEMRGDEAKYSAIAGKDGVSGTSSQFLLELGEEKEVVVKLAQPIGIAVLRAEDATTGKALGSGNAIAFLRADDSRIDGGSCALAGGACEIQIPANKLIYFKITSAGFVEYESEDFSVEPEETKTLEAGLVPAALRNELRITFEGIADPKGSGMYLRTLPALARGEYYYAKFSLNIPVGSEKAGMFLKVSGSDPVSAKDDMVSISGFEKPENAIATKGFSFRPSPSCKNDVISEEDAGNAQVKWLNYEYRKQQNTKAVVLKIFLKPIAKAGDEFSIDFRAYAEKAGIFTRSPDDAEFGKAERSAGKDWCYAALNRTRFKVEEDRFSCNERACVSLLFSADGTHWLSRGFSAEFGQKFTVKPSVRALRAFSDSPYATLQDDQEVKFYGFSFAGRTGDAAEKHEQAFQLENLAEGQTVSGNVEAQGTIPSAFSKMSLQFGDNSGMISQYSAFVTISGKNEFVMQVSPAEIEANDDRSIAVLLKNSVDESPIADATVSIEENEDAVFEGGTPDSIVGDGSEDAGMDGKYVFRRLHPLNTGSFRVVAKREGFRDAEAGVKVTLNDFLEASAASLVLSCDGTTLDLSNLLSAQVNVLAKSTCVEVLGEGVNKVGLTESTFSIKGKRSKSLTLNPVRQGQNCDLQFDAEAGGAHANVRLPMKVSCSSLQKFCKVDADCGSGASCVNSECQKQSRPDLYPQVPNPIIIQLDENYQYNEYFSISQLAGNGQVTGCEIRSSETDEAERMENYVSVDCSAENILSISADYFPHPFYKAPEIPQNYYNECYVYDPSNPACANYQNLNPTYVPTYNPYGTGTVYTKGEEPSGGDGDNSFSSGAKTSDYNDAYNSELSFEDEPLPSDYAGCPDPSDPECADASPSPEAEIEFVDVHAGILYVNFANKPQARVSVRVRGPPSPYEGTAGAAVVYVTERGFAPPQVQVPENGKVIWINVDDEAHTVSSFSGAFDSGNLQPGKKFSTAFQQAGVYNYRDRTGFASRRGIVYVGSLDTTCRYKNLNYFAQKFVGYMAKSLTRFFDPSGGKSQQIAYSSVYKFYVTPNGINSGIGAGLAPQAVYGNSFNPYTAQYNPFDPRINQYYQGSGQYGTNQYNPGYWQQYGTTSTFSSAQDQGICVKEGAASFTCRVELSPIIPANGAAFTIVNDYVLYAAAPSQLLVASSSEDNKYLLGLYVDKAGPDGFIVGKLQDLNSLFLSAPRYATFILTNDPRKIEYYADGAEVKIRFRGLPEGTTELTQAFSAVFSDTRQAFSVKMIFTINNKIGKYAILKIPEAASILSRMSDDAGTKEPAFLLNNIPASKLTAADASAIYGTGKLGKLAYLEPSLKASGNSLPTKLDRKFATDSLTLPLSSDEGYDETVIYDVVGGVGAEGQGALSCSGKDYCTSEQYSAAETVARKEIEEYLKGVRIQRLDFAGFGDYAARRFAEALALTLQDYVADKAQYALCGGTRALREGACRGPQQGASDYNCYGGGTYCDNSISGGEFWALTKDQFGQAACDSEVLNNFEAVAASGNWDLFKSLVIRKLMQSNAFMPRIQYTKPIVGTDKLEILVLYKRAADSGATAGYVIKGYKPLQGEQQGGGLEGYIPLDEWLSLTSVEREQTEAEKIVEAVLTSAPSTGVQAGGLSAVRFEGTSVDPYYFYLGKAATGSVQVNLDDGKPNLFTMNKYPFNFENDKLGIFEGELKTLAMQKPADPNAIKAFSCNVAYKKPAEADAALEIDNFGLENSCESVKSITGFEPMKLNVLRLESPASLIMASADGKKLIIVSASRIAPCKNQTATTACIGDYSSTDDLSASSTATIKAALKYLLDEGASADFAIEGIRSSLGDGYWKPTLRTWMFAFEPVQGNPVQQESLKVTEAAEPPVDLVAGKLIERIVVSEVPGDDIALCANTNPDISNGKYLIDPKSRLCVKVILNMQAVETWGGGSGVKVRVLGAAGGELINEQGASELVGGRMLIERGKLLNNKVYVELVSASGQTIGRYWFPPNGVTIAEKPAAVPVEPPDTGPLFA